MSTDLPDMSSNTLEISARNSNALALGAGRSNPPTGYARRSLPLQHRRAGCDLAYARDMSSRQTIVQPGESNPRDLFIFVHIDAPYVRQEARLATRDAVVAELWGAGTSAYRPLLAAYGGLRGWVAGIVQRLGPDAMIAMDGAPMAPQIRRVCLTTWSAGSQVAKDVCAGADWPDALVMLDGLYGNKPAGSRAGDGRVVMDAGLAGIARYAAAAARGERVCVILHSAIPTPYASSSECAAAVRAAVEAETRLAFQPVELPELSPLREAWQIGNLTIVGYAGATGAEHVREAHLFDEIWTRFVPFATDEDTQTMRAPPPDLDLQRVETIGDRATELSLQLADARVGESPAGSNISDPRYWQGITRIVHGVEVPLNLAKRPAAWCAAGFCFASVQAALALGHTAEAIASWRTGPVPHGQRASVLEVQSDMTSRGLFHAAAQARAGAYEPQRGDAVFLDRSSDPAEGHVARYVRRLDANTFETVGGNEHGHEASDLADRWRVTERRFDDQRLRGFGEFPRA